MNELIIVFKQFGVAMAILVVATWFVVYRWWPYWKVKDQERDSERRKMLDRMMALQEGSLKEMTDALRSQNRLSEKISDHLEELTDEIRRK